MPLVIAGENAKRNADVLRARRPPVAGRRSTAEMRRAQDQPTTGGDAGPGGAAVPAGPGGAAVPAGPGGAAVPAGLGGAAVLVVPGDGAAPAVLVVPGDAAAPAVPAAQGDGAAPAAPAVPVVPGDGAAPAAPAVPVVPGDGAAPAAPAVPVVPGDGAAPAVPAAPGGCEWLPGPAGQAMARRQAVRDFADSPVPAAQVLAIIAAARGADASLWPPRSHSAGTFEILVAAFGVGGMPRGLYPAGAGFGTRMAQVEPGWLDSLRDQYADAPVLLLICADLNGACRAAGPAGYPSMLVRAGTLGYAAWLAGIAGGLAGWYTAAHPAG